MDSQFKTPPKREAAKKAETANSQLLITEGREEIIKEDSKKTSKSKVSPGKTRLEDKLELEEREKDLQKDKKGQKGKNKANPIVSDTKTDDDNESGKGSNKPSSPTTLITTAQVSANPTLSSSSSGNKNNETIFSGVVAPSKSNEDSLIQKKQEVLQTVPSLPVPQVTQVLPVVSTTSHLKTMQNPENLLKRTAPSNSEINVPIKRSKQMTQTSILIDKLFKAYCEQNEDICDLEIVVKEDRKQWKGRNKHRSRDCKSTQCARDILYMFRILPEGFKEKIYRVQDNCTESFMILLEFFHGGSGFEDVAHLLQFVLNFDPKWIHPSLFLLVSLVSIQNLDNENLKDYMDGVKDNQMGYLMGSWVILYRLLSQAETGEESAECFDRERFLEHIEFPLCKEGGPNTQIPDCQQTFGLMAEFALIQLAKIQINKLSKSHVFSYHNDSHFRYYLPITELNAIYSSYLQAFFRSPETSVLKQIFILNAIDLKMERTVKHVSSKINIFLHVDEVKARFLLHKLIFQLRNDIRLTSTQQQSMQRLIDRVAPHLDDLVKAVKIFYSDDLMLPPHANSDQNLGNNIKKIVNIFLMLQDKGKDNEEEKDKKKDSPQECMREQMKKLIQNKNVNVDEFKAVIEKLDNDITLSSLIESDEMVKLCNLTVMSNFDELSIFNLLIKYAKEKVTKKKATLTDPHSSDFRTEFKRVSKGVFVECMPFKDFETYVATQDLFDTVKEKEDLLTYLCLKDNLCIDIDRYLPDKCIFSLGSRVQK